MNKLQTIQNSALRIATGCTLPTDSPHLHNETRVLTLHQHLDMKGAQFFSSTLDPTHTCHSLHNRPNRSRHKKVDPTSYYIGILDSLPPAPKNRSTISHIHTHLTTAALSNKPNNKILQEPPPPLTPIETSLPRRSRTTLSQLRSGKHPSLNTFKHLIDPTHSPNCPSCPNSKHTAEHIILNCPALNSQRTTHNITSLQDLWTAPLSTLNFLEDVGFHPMET